MGGSEDRPLAGVAPSTSLCSTKSLSSPGLLAPVGQTFGGFSWSDPDPWNDPLIQSSRGAGEGRVPLLGIPGLALRDIGCLSHE